MRQFSDRARFERDHHWAPKRMSGYLDGDLAARARARMEHHLGECHDCRRLLAGLRVVVDGLHRLSARSGGVDAVQLAAAVRPRLSEQPRP
jgi:anti-sigma factor RsiW